MKKIIETAIAMSIIVFLTSVFWLQIQKVQQTQQKSDIYYPLTNIFSDLQKTLQDGNIKLLQRKINLLSEG